MKIEQINENYAVVTIERAGKTWEVLVLIDPDSDGGITATIAKDGIVCTETGFDWDEEIEGGFWGDASGVETPLP